MAPLAKLKVAVLVSGRGSNLQALIDACADPAYPAEIVLVLANIPGVFALERAAKAGIPTTVVSHKDYPDRTSFEAAMNARLESSGAGLICMAGFMRLLTDGFVNGWHDRLINIHPSLLPAFKGLHVQEAALRAGVRFSGCTVHYVRPAMDAGPILVQAVVPIHQDDDADRLAERILEQEHVIYPLAVRLIAEGRCRVIDERVVIEGAGPARGALVNPAAG
ncbi:MAG: phosphoribosylglycinamide formyltransferase [Magnetospirillum sp. WYHS-4]